MDTSKAKNEAMIVEEVKKHYVDLWGEPSRSAMFSLSGYTIEIYKWNAEAHPQEVNFYATIGMSAFKLAQADFSHRTELYVGFLPAEDRIAAPLALLALEPAINKTSLGDGHTVTFDEPLWEGSSMKSFLIRRSFSEKVPSFQSKYTDWHVEFLQAIPIFSIELKYKKECGVNSLMKKWKELEVAYWSPNRYPSW